MLRMEDNEYLTSPTSGAPPGESPYYNRAFWASYKGLSRGLMGGVLLGAGLGIAVGGVVAAGLLATGLIAGASAGLATLGVVGAFGALGTKYYKDVFSLVGAVAGSNSAVMEIAEQRTEVMNRLNEQRSEVLNRKLDKLLEIATRKLGVDGKEIDSLNQDIGHIKQESAKEVDLIKRRGEQYFEQKFNRTPPVFWKIALFGALTGAVLGAMMIGGGYLMFDHMNVLTDLLGQGGHAAATAGEAAAHGVSALSLGAAAGATLLGSTLAGATYGINRHYYRQFINFTNALYEGDLKLFDKQRAQERENIIEVCDGRPGAECDAVHHVTGQHAPALPATRVSAPQPQGRAEYLAPPVQAQRMSESDKAPKDFRARLGEEAMQPASHSL